MPFPQTDRNAKWISLLALYQQRAKQRSPLLVEGKVTRMVGLTLEAIGCRAPVGGRCIVQGVMGGAIEAEVVGFAGEKLYLMPTGPTYGLEPGSRVIPLGGICEAHVGRGLIGRVVDGGGHPLDDKGPIDLMDRTPLMGIPQNPLSS